MNGSQRNKNLKCELKLPIILRLYTCIQLFTRAVSCATHMHSSVSGSEIVTQRRHLLCDVRTSESQRDRRWTTHCRRRQLSRIYDLGDTACCWIIACWPPPGAVLEARRTLCASNRILLRNVRFLWSLNCQNADGDGRLSCVSGPS